jgi:DNA-binding NarL/FixJ family response regulator
MVKTVILVDDNQDFLSALKEFLDSWGPLEVVQSFTSARAALNHLERQQPDLMIVDVAMPEMNGLELTNLVRQRWPSLRIIILTLFDTPLHRQAALEAGASGFVTKSSMADDLIPTIEHLS